MNIRNSTIAFGFSLLLAASLQAQPRPERLNGVRSSETDKSPSREEGLRRAAPADPATLRMDAWGRLQAARAEWVDVFVRLDGDVDLSATGFRERARAGGIAVGRIASSSVPALLRAPGVRYVEGARMRERRNQAGNQLTGVDRIHTGQGLNRAYTGAGVVVGVLDSGIDFTHPDFSAAGGGTRIRYVLDMQENGTDVVYTKAQIDATPGSIAQRDGDGSGGHGTHVTSTAAGRSGVAPDADIVFVKGIREPDSWGGFYDTDVAEGVSFIFEKADELDRPAVVNLSLGGLYGPLDGTSAYEQFLSGLTGPGRIIVAAAGNDGGTPVHAGVQVAPETLYETALYPVDPFDNYIELWADPGALEAVAIGVYEVDEDGFLVWMGRTEYVALGDMAGVDAEGFLDAQPIEIDGTIYGYYAIDARTTADPGNGDANAFVVITDNGTSVDLEYPLFSLLYASGTATNGRIDLWASGPVFYPEELGLEEVVEVIGDTRYTVGSPATSHDLIAVGSFTSRTRWTDLDGVNRIHMAYPDWFAEDALEPTIGAISEFSSGGPTRDGRVLPHIAAPGERVVAALSSHLTVHSDPEAAWSQGGTTRADVVQGGLFQTMAGTSMAAPHVTGVVALLLELDPDLTPAEIRSLLAATATVNGQTGAVPNARWGAGRLNAHAAMAQLVSTSIDDREPGSVREFGLLPAYPNPFNPSTVVGYQLSVSGHTRLAVYDLLGREVAVLVDAVQAPGAHQVAFDGSGLASGMYLVRLSSDSGTQVRAITLLK